jgi:hypothetical protein
MERFVYNANIEHYRRLIAESELDPSRDEDRRAASGARLTFAVSIARGLEMPAALVAGGGEMIE